MNMKIVLCVGRGCGMEGARIQIVNIIGTQRRMKRMGMTIRRKTQDFGLPAGIIEIELTDEEIEQAFRVQEKRYRMEDAENAIQTLYEGEQISEDDMEKIKENKKFKEAVLDMFDKRFNCNVPENVIWEIAVKEVLKEVDKYAADDN